MNKAVLCSKSLKSSHENMTISSNYCHDSVIVSHLLTRSHFIYEYA